MTGMAGSGVGFRPHLPRIAPHFRTLPRRAAKRWRCEKGRDGSGKRSADCHFRVQSQARFNGVVRSPGLLLREGDGSSRRRHDDVRANGSPEKRGTIGSADVA